MKISNPGSAALSIGISVTGANSSDFLEADNCPPSLAASSFCTVNITFAPALASPPAPARTASLKFTDNAAGSPQTIPLSGSVVQSSVSMPGSVNFGSQLAGTSGLAQPVTMTDTGTGALAVTAVTVTGTNAADFVADPGNCTNQTTPVAGSCAIQIKFAPIQAPLCGTGGGARSATVNITDNAPGSPHSVGLAGTAMEFCFNSSTGAASSVPVTAGATATYSLFVNSSGGFSGSAALACSDSIALSTCTITTTPPTTPPSVTLTPAAPGQFQVAVTTTANSASSSIRSFRGPRSTDPSRRIEFIARASAILLVIVLFTLEFSRLAAIS